MKASEGESDVEFSFQFFMKFHLAIANSIAPDGTPSHLGLWCPINSTACYSNLLNEYLASLINFI